ncbi:B3 domain-containing protein [Sesbania bispinosa]|nr:B3 domain-containing protein [Sesbania bispinosa]
MWNPDEDYIEYRIFRDGVPEMLAFYGLEGKHFIILNYNGDRKFDFQIVNSDLVEIQYPPLPNQANPAIPPQPVPLPNVVPPAVVHPQVQNEGQRHPPADIIG